MTTEPTRAEGAADPGAQEAAFRAWFDGPRSSERAAMLAARQGDHKERLAFRAGYLAALAALQTDTGECGKGLTHDHRFALECLPPWLRERDCPKSAAAVEAALALLPAQPLRSGEGS